MASKTGAAARVAARPHASGPAGLIDRSKTSESSESSSSPRSDGEGGLQPSSPRVPLTPGVLQRGGSKKLPPRSAPSPRRPSEAQPAASDEFE